ncbi:MAG: NAD(P)-dependent oxidoreductase [Anaerolineae bacterium]|nr:NAD(P)-dependent oxidoreductase [Anaerolineae bacterium]
MGDIEPQPGGWNLEPGTTIFLTGATGFIGARLAQALLNAGAEVAALTLPAEADRLPAGVRGFSGDVCDETAVLQAVQAFRPRMIIHLAAIGVTHPDLPLAEAIRVNVGGTIHVLNAAGDGGGVQRIVVAGTSYEHGAARNGDGLDPFNAYSASKVAAWACARAAYNAWHAPVVWLRPFQVYGPGQRNAALIPSAIRAALTGADFPMTAGEQQRDFIFVDDVVRGFMAAMVAPGIEGHALDLGTGILYRVRDVVTHVWQLAGARGKMRVGVLPYRPGEVPAIRADVEHARQLLGWQAQVPLETGLQRTIEAMNRI